MASNPEKALNYASMRQDAWNHHRRCAPSECGAYLPGAHNCVSVSQALTQTFAAVTSQSHENNDRDLAR